MESLPFNGVAPMECFLSLDINAVPSNKGLQAVLDSEVEAKDDKPGSRGLRGLRRIRLSWAWEHSGILWTRTWLILCWRTLQRWIHASRVKGCRRRVSKAISKLTTNQNILYQERELLQLTDDPCIKVVFYGMSCTKCKHINHSAERSMHWLKY
ncbi:hypothetical protein SELMODRAFT_408225 [Selaginella moellendorffii]|uniref:Uncharacterized protein n=1 Tax=Selaginella moellendorffii TaxID=88036 RepID=D8R7L3_SELML|nr:hypothetical protein SELMODRAFT_408225 [Selaginella moellendorffii]